MKWGKRKKYDKKTDFSHGKENTKKIRTNPDGSKTIPAGFVFNRVGGATMDVNSSGGLYVSHGKQDAARYVKNLGPTPINKLLKSSASTIQHITVKGELKVPSDDVVTRESAKVLLSNKKMLDSFNESLYSVVVTGDFDKTIDREYIERAIKNPSGKEAKKLSYGINSFLGDPTFSQESKTVYDHFRKQGYDAIPDVHDIMSGTSTTATIIINPDKVKVTSTTSITKDVLKEGKQYVKSIEKLKVSDVIK